MSGFEQQLQVIAQLQRHLLPRALPTLADWSLAVNSSLSPWPGGDYYDFLPLPDGRLVLIVADASGHGGPAAVMMALTRVTIHTCPLSSGRARSPFCPLDSRNVRPPRLLLGHLNRVLVENTLDDQFMTAFCAILNPAEASLHCANAGHPPPRWWRAATGTIAALPDIGGLPLGIDADVIYREEVLRIERGDVLLCYTDGVTEALNRQGEPFGCQRLDECLAAAAFAGAAAVSAAVTEGLETFLAGAVPHDDRTVLVIQRLP